MYILELGRAAVIRSIKWHIKQSATEYHRTMRNNHHIKVYITLKYILSTQCHNFSFNVLCVRALLRTLYNPFHLLDFRCAIRTNLLLSYEARWGPVTIAIIFYDRTFILRIKNSSHGTRVESECALLLLLPSVNSKNLRFFTEYWISNSNRWPNSIEIHGIPLFWCTEIWICTPTHSDYYQNKNLLI